MHDYAHGGHNTHILTLFSDQKDEHFHIICPKNATQSDLKKLLNIISDEDLNNSEKNELKKSFQLYCEVPNIERVISLSEGTARVLTAFAYGELKNMPNFYKQFEEINNNETHPLFIRIRSMGDYAQKLNDIGTELTNYRSKIITKEELILKIKFIFFQIEKIELTNFDAMSKVRLEIEKNFPASDMGKLCDSIAKDLSVIFECSINFKPTYSKNNQLEQNRNSMFGSWCSLFCLPCGNTDESELNEKTILKNKEIITYNSFNN
jgi:hypothetical protein